MRHSSDVKSVIQRFWDEEKLFRFACMSGDISSLKEMLKQDLDVMWSNKKLATGFVLAASRHRFRVVKWLYKLLTFKDCDLYGCQLFTPDIRALQFYVKHCNFSKAFWSEMFEEAVMQKNQHVADFIFCLFQFDTEFFILQNDMMCKFLVDAHLSFKKTDLEKMQIILKEICTRNGECAVKYWKTGIVCLETLIHVFKEDWDINVIMDIWKLGVLRKEHVHVALLDAIHSNNVKKATYLFRLGFFTPQAIRSAFQGYQRKKNWLWPTMLEFLWSYNIFEKQDILVYAKDTSLDGFIESPKLLPLIFEWGLFEKELWRNVEILKKACFDNSFQSLLFLTQTNLFSKSDIDSSVCETCQLRLQLRKKKRCFE